MPSLTDIIDQIHWWIQKTDTEVPAKIAAAYQQRGGWEGWAQVEIAYTIAIKYPHVAIDREVNVYEGTRKKNDFVIVEGGRPHQIIELKCERSSQDEAAFLKAFAEDCGKIHAGPIKGEYRPADGLAVGICVNLDTYEHVMKNSEYRITGVQVGNFWVVRYSKHID